MIFLRETYRVAPPKAEKEGSTGVNNLDTPTE